MQSRQTTGGFRLEEATIEDVHRAIGDGELTSARLVEHYLRRVEAYNGHCVAGAVDAATGLQLGEITPLADARQVNALTVVNVRGRRSLTDRQDADPEKPDALETARRLDAAYATTGRLTGPLHGIPVVIKDQFDTVDMRTTSGAMAPYADDLARLGAEVVDPVDFRGAIAALVPALEPSALATSTTTVRDNAFLTATALPGIAELLAVGADPARLPADVNLRSLSELGLGAATTGEVRYMLNAYLQQRGDAAVRSVDDLLAGSTFYQFPSGSAQTLRTVEDGRVTATRTVPGDGITEPADRRLFSAVYRTDDRPDGTRTTAPVTTLDARGAVVRRATLQAVVARVMADQRLDALVYPTKTIPAPVLGAAVAPTVDNRPALARALSPISGLPAVAVPAGFTREVLDWQAPPVLTQQVLVDGTPTPVRVYDPDRYDPRRFAPPKAVALPVSLDFLGQPFSEPTLLRIAAAYEQGTRHRRPPGAFSPLPGEP